jgi:hypothetical protein
MATRTDKALAVRTPRVSRTPVPRQQAGTALEPVVDVDKAAGSNTTARLELALAEALTGGDMTKAAQMAGVSKQTFDKALRLAQRDEYAVVRDRSRLKVITKMYDTLEEAVAKVAARMASDQDLDLQDYLSVIDKLGLRLACVENLRTSIAEDLASHADREGGVQRTRAVIETVRSSGSLTVAQADVLDKMLGIASLPSSATSPTAGVVLDVEDAEVVH